MSKEAMKLALEALETERPYLGPMPTKTSKAIATLREALAEQPAPVQQEPVALRNAVFTVLEGFTLPHDVRKILETAYYTSPQPAQQQQEPQTHAQERTEFEQFWVDELGEADELTYGKLGYAIRRVDVAWEAWKAGKISANQQTIMGREAAHGIGVEK